jgi:hypothetical protein
VRAWRWARGVIADRGEHAPVPVFLEAGGTRLRFGEVARIEVRRRVNDHPHPVLKEIHSCEVAGRTLEAANVYALRAKVAALLESIAPARILPLCYFVAHGMELPVYPGPGRLTVPLLGRRGVDLASLRRDVARQLDTDDVRLLVLRPSDLRLVPPAAVLRSTTEPEVWLPCIDGVSLDGPVVGVLERREIPAAPDVVALLHAMAPLYAADVRPDQWARGEARLRDIGRRLVAPDLELSIWRTVAGDLVTAVEDRGISCFSAGSEAELAETLRRYLTTHGFLRFASDVEVRTPAPTRSERLDPDAIRTPEPEEAQV